MSVAHKNFRTHPLSLTMTTQSNKRYLLRGSYKTTANYVAKCKTSQCNSKWWTWCFQWLYVI